MKHILIVAPHFPPASLAGVHRARHLAKWLPKNGWTPVIIRVDESYYTETLDPALGKLVPKTVIQERVSAIPAGMMRKFGIGDVGLRSFWSLKREIERSAKRYDAKAVLITGSPFYPMMLAGFIKNVLKLPVVLDFQDPWVSVWGETLPKFSKGGVVHQIATLLEPKALRSADYVTSVSDLQNEALAARYPWLNARKMAGIPIGGDPEDFDFLREVETDIEVPWLDRSKLNLSYVGTFLPRAEPVVRALFKGVAQLNEKAPTLTENLKLNFIGTSNQPDGTKKTVMPIAEQEGVSRVVAEIPNRIPFIDALRTLATSDGLLLIGSDEPHYTASKIYPGLMSGTPFLSIFQSKSSAHRILVEAGGGVCVDFSTLEELNQKVDTIADSLHRLILNGASFPCANASLYAEFTAEAVSSRYAKIFNEICV